jgi:hypothetical protein
MAGSIPMLLGRVGRRTGRIERLWRGEGNWLLWWLLGRMGGRRGRFDSRAIE